ncbi:hypothetical protein M0802_016435, partial [Mischocyttarus mexicanus]
MLRSGRLPAPLPICRECLGATVAINNNNTKRNNSASASEKLSRCSVCGAALHNSCAPSELTLLVERGITWSCDGCSPICAGCQLERESQNYLVKCAGCVKCYHPNCLDPALDKKSKAPWRCRHCQTAHTPVSKDDGKRRKSQDASAVEDTSTSARKRLCKLRENRKSTVSRKSLIAPTPNKRGNSAGVAQVDCSSDGNAGVVSPRQLPLIPSPLPQPPTPLAGQGRLLEEKNDRISKEKQKFFRLSVFNADHNKLKRVGGGDKCRPSQNVSPRSTRGNANLKKVVPSKSVPLSSSSSSSSSEASESDSSDGSDSTDDDDDDEEEEEDDDDEEEEEEGNSSSESSGSSSSEESREEEQNETPKPKGPFSCDLNEDKPWGFAAAAAKLNTESPFFSNINNTFGAPLPKLDVSNTPTFGIHIQPAAVLDCSKKQQKNATNSFPSMDSKIKPGTGQLKSLFDGLSHFFSAPTNSRARTGAQAPNYAPGRRKRSNTDDGNRTNKVFKATTGQRGKREVSPGARNKSKERRKIGSNEDLASRTPRPGIFVPSNESLFGSMNNNEKPPKMTPSNLVKTAVNSKRHEHERRKLMKDDTSLVKCADVTDLSSISSSPSSSMKHEQQQQQHSRKKEKVSEAGVQSRHPAPATPKSSGLCSSDSSVKSNPNLKPNPRACTSAIT